jgi:hypothetical protein
VSLDRELIREVTTRAQRRASMAVQAFVRTAGVKARTWFPPIGRLLRSQWPALACLLIAVTLCIATLVVRLLDSRTAPIDDGHLDAQAFGIFTDTRTNFSLMYHPTPETVELGVELPKPRWIFEVEPGRIAHGTITLILSEGSSIWDFNVADSIEIVARLPRRCRTRESTRAGPRRGRGHLRVVVGWLRCELRATESAERVRWRSRADMRRSASRAGEGSIH